jgi:hypothetical protein
MSIAFFRMSLEHRVRVGASDYSGSVRTTSTG